MNGGARSTGNPSDKKSVFGHRMVLTGKRRNGNVLRVRCTCMAEYPIRGRVSLRYFNYDWLGEATELIDVIQIYKAHLLEVAHRAGDTDSA